MKRIIIVGGGVGGLNLAKELDKKRLAEVVLVEPKEYMEVPYAELRALVEPQEFSPTIREKYSLLLPNVQHIMKKAAGIEDGKVKLDDDSEVGFDYLVIASGSTFKNWPFLKSHEPNMTARQEEVAKGGAELEKAKSILIIGGGAVGVELAGEIAYKWNDKKVTLANGNSRILSGLSEKMTSRSKEILNKLGVQILNNARIKKQEEDGSWSDEEGKIYKADVIYQAVSMDLNSEWLNDSNIELTDRGGCNSGAGPESKGI